MSQRLRCLLAVAILVVPVAIVAPGYLRDELHRANGNSSAFALPGKFHWPQYNRQLAAGIVALVPAHASMALVGGNVGSAPTRWLAFVTAPRQLTDLPATWTIVLGQTPAQANLHPVRAWQYGDDWLVER